MVKKHIPKKIKNDSWDKYIGREKGVHKCLCCFRTDIEQKDFVAGHIVSEKNGGKININNIIPICKGCNGSMGIMNMCRYIELYEPHRYIWFKNNILKNKPIYDEIVDMEIDDDLDLNDIIEMDGIEYLYDWINTSGGIKHRKYYEHKLRNKIYYISDDKYKYIFNKLKSNKVGVEVGKYSNKNYPIFYKDVSNEKKIELYFERFDLKQVKQIYFLLERNHITKSRTKIIKDITEKYTLNNIKNLVYNLSFDINYIKECKCKITFLTRKTTLNNKYPKCNKCKLVYFYHENLIN